MKYIFIPEFDNYLDPFSILGSACKDSVQFQINSRRGSCSRENEKVGHFTLSASVAEDGNETYQKLITCVKGVDSNLFIIYS